MPIPKNSVCILAVAVVGVVASSACGGGSSGTNEVVTPPLSKSLCFDNSIYAAGASFKLNFKEMPSGQIVITEGSVQSINASFETTPDLVQFTERTDNAVQTSLVRYFKPVAAGVIALYATEAAQGTLAYTTTRYAPPYEDRRAELGIGESKTYTGQGSRTQSSLLGTSTTPYTRQEIVKFVGIESLEMPAGTFTTCRYEIDGTTEWWHRGMVVRRDLSNGESRVLQSGELNGTPLKSQ